MKPACIAILIIFLWGNGYTQVAEIETASLNNLSSSTAKSDSYSNSSSDGVELDFLFTGIADWQTAKLKDDRKKYPSTISLDVMFQGAVKPSSYYILWPRIRGSWGLLGTDFRMNYLIKEGSDGYTHIRTNDWQILQLNLVTSSFFTFRASTGIMKEAFNSKRTFSETAFILNVHAPDQSKVIGFEYRFAKDWSTGINPRREFSVQYQHQLFKTGIFHGYTTAGAVYQKYYNSIEVWGIQAGVMFRFF
jgi:hypothetical protein